MEIDRNVLHLTSPHQRPLCSAHLKLLPHTSHFHLEQFLPAFRPNLDPPREPLNELRLVDPPLVMATEVEEDGPGRRTELCEEDVELEKVILGVDGGGEVGEEGELGEDGPECGI